MNKGMDSSEEKDRRIGYLIGSYIRQTLSPEEHDELDRWVEESDENMQLFVELTDEENIEAGLADMKRIDTAAAYQKISPKIPFRKKKSTGKVWVYAVAASVILLIIAGYFFMPSKNKEKQTTPLAATKNDLLPGSDKAVLTLGNGRKIILQDQGKGAFVYEEGLSVVKLDSGQIAYNGSDIKKNVWNTLTTPRGGQYAVILSDGTRVWLNAASSLKYPAIFNARERKVELDGEAYFEVTHDKEHPFHVVSKNQDVTVLGTRFNVNAYSDEALVTTSLLEGKIQLTSQHQRSIVQPGEQFSVNVLGLIQKNPMPDMEEATAWRGELFHFKNAGIEEILKQVSRWYDAEIIYEGRVEKHFNADISRKLPVSQLLNLLEKTGGVHFDIEGKKIKVRP
jgi:ferric-dicitrate binding protein FerR (iron transport regulator)